MQCNCIMGLLPEINRAWLVIDSNIYLWNYENGRDLAYFDGLNEVILSAGLVLPKTGVFQDHIQFLLCLATAVEIVILGVSFTGKKYVCSCILCIYMYANQCTIERYLIVSIC